MVTRRSRLDQRRSCVKCNELDHPRPARPAAQRTAQLSRRCQPAATLAKLAAAHGTAEKLLQRTGGRHDLGNLNILDTPSPSRDENDFTADTFLLSITSQLSFFFSETIETSATTDTTFCSLVQWTLRIQRRARASTRRPDPHSFSVLGIEFLRRLRFSHFSESFSSLSLAIFTCCDIPMFYAVRRLSCLSFSSSFFLPSSFIQALLSFLSFPSEI